MPTERKKTPSTRVARPWDGSAGTVVAAAVQATPVFLDRDATIERVAGLVKEAAAEGAGLIVFPEVFVPAYPDWVWRASVWSETSEALFGRLMEQSVVVGSAASDALGAAAKRAKAWLSIGVNERERGGSTIFNTQLTFAPDGTLAGRHRKVMPTGGERLVWGMGDGSTLEVYDTGFGRLGGLICWENYMPLARTAMYAKGVDVWVAPTWDNGEVWLATLRHIAKEGRVYVIGVTTLLRASDVPDDVPGKEELWSGGDDDWSNDGWSAIVAPDGEVLAGPLVKETGILYAELDIAKARRQRHQNDPVGHYARPDIFRLTVDESAKPTVGP